MFPSSQGPDLTVFVFCNIPSITAWIYRTFRDHSVWISYRTVTQPLKLSLHPTTVPGQENQQPPPTREGGGPRAWRACLPRTAWWCRRYAPAPSTSARSSPHRRCPGWTLEGRPLALWQQQKVSGLLFLINNKLEGGGHIGRHCSALNKGQIMHTCSAVETNGNC